MAIEILAIGEQFMRVTSGPDLIIKLSTVDPAFEFYWRIHLNAKGHGKLFDSRSPARYVWSMAHLILAQKRDVLRNARMFDSLSKDDLEEVSGLAAGRSSKTREEPLR